MFSNKARAFLTIFGIALGLLLYVYSSLVFNAVINIEYESNKYFDKNTVIVKNAVESDILETISELKEFSCIRYDLTQSNVKIYKYKGNTVFITFNVFGTDCNFTSMPILSNIDSDKCINNKIIYGTDLKEEDIYNRNEVAVIERSCAKALFGKEDAIGETFNINLEGTLINLTVCGIMLDTPQTVENNINYNKILNNKDIIEKHISFNIYIPYSIISQLENVYYENSYIFKFSDSSLADGAVFLDRYIGGETISYSKIMGQIANNVKVARNTVIIILIIIIVFSGLFIMTTLFFSIKERISEIGLRRSLGASTFNIMQQFILEGVLLCLISSFISIITGAFIYMLTLLFLLNNSYIFISTLISYEVFLSAVCISIIQGVIFSLFPAIYASKIRPVEALRFE